MSERKGFFERAAERLRKPAKPPTNEPPIVVERGPAQHVDDGRMHISGGRDDGSNNSR